MQPVIIELRNASKYWYAGTARIPILVDVSLDIREGESVAIMGPSGSGKSTLMHVLACLTPLDQGTIRYTHTLLPPRGIALQTAILRSISFVFQDAKLIPDLTVQDNIAVPLVHRGIPRKARETMVREVLEEVMLSDRASHFPNQLSGGEMMRVAMARAIITRPRVIFADEPTGSLDSQMGERIAGLLYSLVSQETAVVIVTHQQELAARADRIYHIRDGRVG